MDKTTSRELSEQLRDAGTKQESERAWYKCPDSTGRYYVKPLGQSGGWDYVCRAFDCFELLDRLPAGMVLKKHEDRGTIGYNASLQGGAPIQQTPAEALGKLYLWCLQEGHCTE